MGASADQPFEIIAGFEGFRRITLECRGHGASALGPLDDLSIATFADDLLALMDHLGLAQAHVGGISMGAAIATRFAVLHRARVRSLCVARPAWFDRKAPENMAVFALMADCLATHGVEAGRAALIASDAFAALKAASPDNAASLVGQFDRPDPVSTQALLSRISMDGPGIGAADYKALQLPVLVIGHAMDAVHPLAMARAIAGTIPGARLAEITPKTTCVQAYRRDFQAALATFLDTVRTPGLSNHA